MTREALLARTKAQLSVAFGERLKGVVLYGSEARGDAGPDSDVDILVLLVGPVGLWDDARTAVTALYDLQDELARPIHAVPVEAAAFEAKEYALFRSADREGLRA